MRNSTMIKAGALALLLALAALNAHAQQSAKEKALQGTWVSTRECPAAQAGAKGQGMSVDDFLKRYEIAWVFEGNNCAIQFKDLQSKAIIYSQSGTFVVIGEIIQISYKEQGKTDTVEEWPYTLSRNTLTASNNGAVGFIGRKQ